VISVKESFAEDSSMGLVLVLVLHYLLNFLLRIQADSGMCEETVCHFDAASAKNSDFRF
jgi:hypothetical protein